MKKLDYINLFLTLLIFFMVSSCVVEKYTKPSICNVAYIPSGVVCNSIYSKAVYVNNAIYVDMWMQATTKEEKERIKEEYFEALNITESNDIITVEDIATYKTYGKSLTEASYWEITILDSDMTTFSLSYNVNELCYRLVNAINEDLSDECNLTFNFGLPYFSNATGEYLVKSTEINGYGSVDNSSYYTESNDATLYKYTINSGIRLNMLDSYYANLYKSCYLISGELIFDWYSNGDYLEKNKTKSTFNNKSITIEFMNESKGYDLFFVYICNY